LKMKRFSGCVFVVNPGPLLDPVGSPPAPEPTAAEILDPCPYANDNMCAAGLAISNQAMGLAFSDW
jgi:hypothetical protein